jgi:hypothetical protein
MLATAKVNHDHDADLLGDTENVGWCLEHMGCV